MKNLIFLIMILFTLSSCQQKKKPDPKNPLLHEFNTPFEVPPFDLISNGHFIPAAEFAMNIHNEEINAIVQDTLKPGFKNTIVALERSGELIGKIMSVFHNLNSSHTNDEMQEISKQLIPAVTKHRDAIWLNEELFKKVETVYHEKDKLNLDQEDAKLLDETYVKFIRGGAGLPEEKRGRFRQINEELSLLSITFGQNILNETNNFKLIIEDEKDLSGLPSALRETAAKTAESAGMPGKWIFTVHKPSLIPFITYADNRTMRENLFKAYINLGDNDNEFDNKEIIRKIVALRAERAEILGYKTHADFILERNMSKTPANVITFLDQIWKPAIRVAKAEAKQLQNLINSSGENFKLEPWDWWYYTEKVRKSDYDLDEETLREYFVLENVRDGAFEVAKKLFGIQFEQINDIPKYHPDVQAFEVKDADGSHLGVLYMDFFPRESKRSGAWMSEYRGQKTVEGKNIRPVVTTNFNFSLPTAGKPALISYEEAETLFHEFGHALHGLLSQCKYSSLSGTSVPRDFVELPSQIMENWAANPEVMKLYAKHYLTGEIIPDDILEKLDKSSHFNQGFATVEYMSACYLDMDYHTLTNPANITLPEFEELSMQNMGMIPEIVVRYRSTYFSHIFSGGYSAGYYSYIWAEVLDSDAFQAFKETSLFDQSTAKAFRENILEKGGTDDPMSLYVKFRGKEPDISALLKKRGLL